MSNSPVRKLTAIMFTDIKGYTALVQHDETDAMEKIDKYRSVLEERTSFHQGKVIEFYGDGALCVFDSVIECIQCGIEMQKAYSDGNDVPVRMGIHTGDILYKDDTVYGDGVNLASRIEAQGVPGSIMISEKVNKELFNHPEIITKSLGHFKLKNVTDPVHIFGIEHPDVVFPLKHFKKAKQKKLLKSLAFVLIGLIFFGGTTLALLNKGNKPILGDQIIIEEFTNLTPFDSLSFIGNIAGHYITEGLTELPGLKVLAFQSKKQLEVLQASLGKNKPLNNGASKVIIGRFQLIGKGRDSISIKANLIEKSTNLQVHTFKEHVGPLQDPMVAIQKLQDEVMGYWASKDDHLAGKAPNYEAYKAYISARDNWDEDDVLVEEKLKLAIKLDPEFLASYFLLTSLYHNQSRYNSSKTVLNKLRAKINEFTERQKNMFFYYDNVQKGNNKLAFEYYEKDYIHDKKDLFVNTSMAVIAIDRVNSATHALEYLKEIPIDSFDLEQCTYCQDRLYIEIAANIKIGNLKRADTLVNKLPQKIESINNFIIQIRLAILELNDQRVINIIKKTPSIFKVHLTYITAWEYLLAQNEDKAAEYANKAIEFYKSRKDGYFAQLYLLKNEPNLALAITDSLVSLDSTDLTALYYNGLANAMLGNRTVADSMVNMMTEYEYSFGLIPYYQAGIYAQMGDIEKAIDKISEAVDKGAFFSIIDRFENDPYLLPLKDNPKYQKIIHPLEDF